MLYKHRNLHKYNKYYKKLNQFFVLICTFMYYIHVHVVDAQAILAHVGLCVLLPSAKTRPCRFLFPTCYGGLVKNDLSAYAMP